MSPKIYFDHNATTPLLPYVQEQIRSHLADLFGNPSSVHWASRLSRKLIRETRWQVARCLSGNLSVAPEEIVFNSGASEGNNHVLRMIVEWRNRQTSLKDRRKVISSAIEHPSVLETLQHLHHRGEIDWIRIGVDRHGSWDWASFQSHLDERVLLVSVMSANHETGLLFPIKEIAAKSKAVGAWVHSDITQAFLKCDQDYDEVDYLVFSGHKIHALKGVGVIRIRPSAPWIPQIVGGPQEKFRRAGTENVLAIASLGWALEYLWPQRDHYRQHLTGLRDLLENEIQQRMSDVIIVHKNAPRLPHVSHFLIPGIGGESFLMKMDIEGFAISSGSACSSGRYQANPNLLALGFPPDWAQAGFRVSLGWGNTAAEVLRFVQVLERNVHHYRNLNQKRGHSSCEFLSP